MLPLLISLILVQCPSALVDADRDVLAVDWTAAAPSAPDSGASAQSALDADDFRTQSTPEKQQQPQQQRKRPQQQNNAVPAAK